VVSNDDTSTVHQINNSQMISPTQLAADLRNKAVKIIFGLSDVFSQQWPGCLLFYATLESHLQELLQPGYGVIWKILGRPKPDQPCEVWYWCFAIVTIIFDTPSKSHGASAADPLSLESIYRVLIKTSTVDPRTINPHGKRQTLRAIFATLCWLSLALKPVLKIATAEQEQGHLMSVEADELLLVEDTFRTVSLDLFSKRPIGKLFRGFRISSQDIVSESSNPYARLDGTLHASSVNFHSLQTIAKLRFIWVDTLAAHLDWNPQERTVSIFRFPSTCVMHLESKKHIGALSEYVHTELSVTLLTYRIRILAELLPNETYRDSPTQDPSFLHREVLLTYRLLFGQSSQSRELAQNLLSMLKKSSQEVDPFLETLCTVSQSRSLFKKLFRNNDTRSLPTKLFPASTIDARGTFIESGSYSAQLDFPIFGRRLLALQNHNLRQQPNRVRDLWRDRRNPLQWYTFWAVIWVGGISIILSALQLAVSSAQLYFAPGST
jgi:hypothetical protein